MKPLLFFAFWLLPFSILAQNMGEIVVNENNSATIAFDQDIDFVVFGNNPPLGENRFEFYDFFTDGSVCVIRGNTPKAPKTSITVKLKDQSVWYGFVLFGDNAKILYSFTSNPLPEKNTSVKKPTMPKNDGLENMEVVEDTVEPFIVSDSETLNEKVRKTTAISREIYTIGQRIGDVSISIIALRNDSKNTFISLEIANNSGNAYMIDGILFKFIEGRRKGIKKDEASTEERVMPVSILGERVVKAYTTEIIGVAIPLFSVDNSGRLEVSVREKDGTRSAILTVRGNVLNKIKIL